MFSYFIKYMAIEKMNTNEDAKKKKTKQKM